MCGDNGDVWGSWGGGGGGTREDYGVSLRGGPECVPGVLMELMGGPGGGLCWKLWGGYGALGEWYGGVLGEHWGALEEVMWVPGVVLGAVGSLRAS